MGKAIDGDSIYNGAYDNASGTALLMEVARAFTNLEQKPARSILFISTAAEEQGLLGSQWYAQSPLFPLRRPWPRSTSTARTCGARPTT